VVVALGNQVALLFKALAKLVLAGIMSPNDARRRLGLYPIDGLDEPKVSMPGGAAAATGPDNAGEDNPDA
jgi:hypothetical protein